MWKKTWQNNFFLAAMAGLANVLAFAPISIGWLIFLTPSLLFLAVQRCKTQREAILIGYVCSCIVMLGGFYWVVYVVKIFGHLPWIVAALCFLLFCGFGALNFPVFTCLAFWIRKKIQIPSRLWFVVFAPALFTIVEWVIPKLFPWAIAHTFYYAPMLIQVSELTGASILTFGICSIGGILGLKLIGEKPRNFTLIPLCLWIFVIAFGFYRLAYPPVANRTLKVAIIQANIGSLEKLYASFGAGNLLQKNVDQYVLLTEQALVERSNPDLIVWPETAMPLLLDVDYGYASQVKRKIQEWKLPLLTGAFMQNPEDFKREFNAAYLFAPPSTSFQTYEKNVLLAFGEYFPLGDTFPILYQWFPQVSDFKAGTTQKVLTLTDGTRLGVSICYEAIVPSFIRKITSQGVQILFNLTNDSWFGPTSEPYQHAALSVFRAVESRAPLVRSTNTGISFTVDLLGQIGKQTPVYQPAFLNTEVQFAEKPIETLFIRFGNWFVYLLALVCAAITLNYRRQKA